VRLGALRGDLSLLRAGLSLGWSFGAGSLEELARTALQLETGIYRLGSLRRSGEHVAFRLENPPVRIGAFRSLMVSWDGQAVGPGRGWVATDRRPELRPIESVSEALPLELETGEGSRFELAVPGPGASGPHRVRVEWVSRAVPPRVWLEFVDHARPAPG
jgi:hypothetical protein